MSLLEENFVLTLLPVFSGNLSKRVVKSNKLYLNDVGLATRLQGWRDLEPLLLSPQLGPAFETLVFTEILRTRDHFNRRWQIFYWRTKHSEEVDFLIEDERGHRIALDAKVSGDPFSHRELDLVLGKEMPLFSVSMTGERLKISSRITRVPITELAEVLLEHLA